MRDAYFYSSLTRSVINTSPNKHNVLYPNSHKHTYKHIGVVVLHRIPGRNTQPSFRVVKQIPTSRSIIYYNIIYNNYT